MKPSTNAVKVIVQSFGARADWQAEERDRLAELLLRISRANGGRVYFDVPLDQATFDDHFRSTCEAAIGRAMRLKARELRGAPDSYRMIDADGASPGLPLLHRSLTVPGLDLDRKRKFLDDPSLKTYLRLGDVPSQTPGAEAERKAEVFAALDEVRRLTVPTPSHDPRRVIAASEILRARKIVEAARRAEARAARDVAGVALLDGAEYLAFLRAALPAASETLRVVMFFCSYQPTAKHPLAALMEELAAAVARGVDVKVILDKDGPQDVFNSRAINRSAFRLCVDRGVPVVFSTANKVIHSKIVLIDGRHVVVGSHNWTLGSSFRYDEKSVYLESRELAGHLEGEFQELWRNGTERAERDRLLAETEDGVALRGAGVYSVDDFLLASDTPEKRRLLAPLLPGGRIDALRRDLLLEDLRARTERVARESPGRVEALERSVWAIPGRARILTFLPHSANGARPGFTVFSLTNSQGEYRGYPFRLRPETTATVRVAIENRTAGERRYSLRIQAEGEPASESQVRLPAGEKSDSELQIAAPADGCKRMVQLTLQTADATPVRAGRLFLVITGEATAG